MKKFREMIKEMDSTIGIDEQWTKEDLIELIKESDLDFDDIMEITDLVIDIIEYGDYDDMSDEELDNYNWDADDYNYDWDEDDFIDEKMSNKAKKMAARRRRKPAFKKIQRLRAKCMKKHGDVVRRTKDSNNPKVCGSDGKIHIGMGRAERRKLAKTRKKNKHKIIQ